MQACSMPHVHGIAGQRERGFSGVSGRGAFAQRSMGFPGKRPVLKPNLSMTSQCCGKGESHNSNNN